MNPISNKSKIAEAYIDCCSLTLFQDIKKEKLFNLFIYILKNLLQPEQIIDIGLVLSSFSEFVSILSVDNKLSWSQKFKHLLLKSENNFTLSIEKAEDLAFPIHMGNIFKNLNETMKALIITDFQRLERLFHFPIQVLFESVSEFVCHSDIQKAEILSYRPSEFEVNLSFEELISTWHNGVGVLNQSNSFIWEAGELIPIKNPEVIPLDQLIGYESQRSVVIENTKRFATGYRVNNMLLYGDRGTGKSATVKAVAAAFISMRVKIVEVRKQDLPYFPAIIGLLKNRNFRFIVFVDDLSFDTVNESYVGLKALLEGGLETRPANILICATSNRRHLVKECAIDRKGLSSVDAETEIRAQDSMQEYLSLADRFGITVIFTSPLQDEYLAIVEGIIKGRKLSVEIEKVRKDALKWEKWYNGRSPRTAKQFVDWLEAGQVAPWDCFIEE